MFDDNVQEVSLFAPVDGADRVFQMDAGSIASQSSVLVGVHYSGIAIPLFSRYLGMQTPNRGASIAVELSAAD